MVQVAWQEVHHYLSSSCSKEATFRDEGGQTRQEISRGLYYSHSGRIRATRWGSEGSDVLRVWPHVSLPLGLVASCGWREQRDCIRYQDIQYFCWTRRAQVIEYSPSTLAIWLLTFYYRYSLRTSSPIYSWWYFASSTSSTAIFGTCPLHLSGNASSSWTRPISLRTSGWQSVKPLLQNTTFPALANSSRKVSRIGFRLTCSRLAEPRWCLFQKALRQSSMMIRGGVLPGCYCSWAMGCKTPTTVPRCWMLLSMNSTELDPRTWSKNTYIDDCPKQNKWIISRIIWCSDG